uniref:Uncharacterized protein n=1 Tax=Steinernema glaseri TaxID=37863 RepID=A0A1I7ZZH2_9BILA
MADHQINATFCLLESLLSTHAWRRIILFIEHALTPPSVLRSEYCVLIRISSRASYLLCRTRLSVFLSSPESYPSVLLLSTNVTSVNASYMNPSYSDVGTPAVASAESWHQNARTTLQDTTTAPTPDAAYQAKLQSQALATTTPSSRPQQGRNMARTAVDHEELCAAEQKLNTGHIRTAVQLLILKEMAKEWQSTRSSLDRDSFVQDSFITQGTMDTNMSMLTNALKEMSKSLKRIKLTPTNHDWFAVSKEKCRRFPQ